MTDKEKSSFQLLFNILLIIFIANLESSLWPRLLSPIPNPQLWLSVVVFTFLYRSKLESLLIVYIPSAFIFILTMQPLGYLLLAQTLLFFAIIAVKNRIFVPGSFYFSVIFSVSVLFFHILLFTFSSLFDVKALSYPQIWKWLIEAVIAFAISPLFYGVLSRLNPIVETGSHEEGDLL